MILFLTCVYISDNFDNINSLESNFNLDFSSKNYTLARSTLSKRKKIINSIHVLPEKSLNILKNFGNKFKGENIMVYYTFRINETKADTKIKTYLEGINNINNIGLEISYSKYNLSYNFYINDVSVFTENIKRRLLFSHCVTIILNSDEVILFMDGYPVYKSEAIDKHDYINNLALHIINNNNVSYTQLGNLVISSNITERYKLLKSTFIKYKEVEYNDYLTLEAHKMDVDTENNKKKNSFSEFFNEIDFSIDAIDIENFSFPKKRKEGSFKSDFTDKTEQIEKAKFENVDNDEVEVAEL